MSKRKFTDPNGHFQGPGVFLTFAVRSINLKDDGA
jgi:hypothetical protein